MDPLALDDHGTHQEQAAKILRALFEQAFDSNEEKLAIAIGKSAEDTHELLGTSGIFDSDMVLKMRGIAINRGVDISDDTLAHPATI